jgi:hypothetical protein
MSGGKGVKKVLSSKKEERTYEVYKMRRDYVCRVFDDTGRFIKNSQMYNLWKNNGYII